MTPERSTPFLPVLALMLPALCLTSCAGPPSKPAAPEPSTGLIFRPTLTYWKTSISGETLITKGGIDGSGTTIDLDHDLSLEPEHTTDLGLELQSGRHHMSFFYQPLVFKGHSLTDSSFVYHGATYPAGTEISSTLGLSFARLTWDYEIWRHEAFDLRAGLEYNLWSLRTHIKGRTPDDTLLDERRGFSHGIPALRAAVDWSHGPLEAGVTTSWGRLPHDRNLFDLELRLATLWLDDRLALGAGYRWMMIDISETTNDGDISLRGPFAMISWRF